MIGSNTRIRPRHPVHVIIVGLALIAACLVAPPASAKPAKPLPVGSVLGSQVTVFDPSMPVSEIQATLDAVHAQQVDNEMGSERYAFLFLPGTYGTAETPLQVKVGYYTEIAGLGAQPTDVTIHGKIEVYNRCLGDGDPPNCIALTNFWRTLSNLTLQIDAAGQDGCRASANFWAVSQAVSMRRLNVTGGGLSLMDYCTAGPQYASGGFIADSTLPNVINGSQQQWLTRNSEIAGWSNAVWNQVFAGTVGAPSDADFPNPPYTTLEQTPVSREKPYLFVDGRGHWGVRVPSAQRNTRGITWGAGLTAGPDHPAARLLRGQAGRLRPEDQPRARPRPAPAADPRRVRRGPQHQGEAREHGGARTRPRHPDRGRRRRTAHRGRRSRRGRRRADHRRRHRLVAVPDAGGQARTPAAGTRGGARIRPLCPTSTSGSAGRTSARPRSAWRSTATTC